MIKKPVNPYKYRKKLYSVMEKKNIHMLTRARITDCLSGKTDKKKELTAKQLIEIISSLEDEEDIYDFLKEFNKIKYHKLIFK